MTLRSPAQLENTKRKLSELEELYNKRKAQAADNDYARKLTLSSLKRLINRLKEDIARYEAKSPAKTE